MTATTAHRRRDAVANRQKLVEAAGKVFADQGLDAPLDEIAKAAGVSIGTLYNHFAGREALVDAVYPERVAAFAEDGRRALENGDPWSGFAGFLGVVLGHQAQDRGLNDAMTLRFPAAPALTKACERGLGDLPRILGRAQRAKQVRADLTMADVACLVWATSRVIATTRDVAPDAWRRFFDLQLDGLRVEGAHPPSVRSMTDEQVATALRR